MLRPLADRLVIEPLERVRSDVIAVVAEEKPNLGRVVAVGPGKRDKKGRIVPLDAKPGDLVRFGTDEGYLTYPAFTEGGKRFLVLQEADVAWVNEDAA
jgi:chaperonin GroES